MKQANVSDPSKCYFVDDNRGNIDAARAEGWGKCVHFCETGLEAMEGGMMRKIGSERDQGAEDNGVELITDLEQLREKWPEIFVQP